jgi:hypothetical protein
MLPAKSRRPDDNPQRVDSDIDISIGTTVTIAMMTSGSVLAQRTRLCAPIA